MDISAVAFVLAVGTFQGPPGVERCSVALSYLDAYRELLAMKQPTGQVAPVNHLVLVRDVAELTLERGQLFLLPPVGGCTIGAVFRGVLPFNLALVALLGVVVAFPQLATYLPRFMK